MILNKKAIGSSIIIMLTFSLLLSILLFTILNITFADRHEFCNDIALVITPTCETRNDQIEFSARNDGSIDAFYEINEILDSKKNILGPESLGTIKIDKESSYEIVPYVRGEDDVLYACVAQTTFVSTGGIPKC